MNPPNPNDPLARALAHWRVSPKVDANFRPAVWQRLRQKARESWASYVRAHFVGWSVVFGLAMVAAGWTGHAVARAKLDASREQMIVAYLVDLDPRVLAKSHASN